MEGRFDETQLEWIRQVLEQHGEFVKELMRAEIEKKKIKVTGDLEESVKYKVTMQRLNPHLGISFLDYGRFIEINYHKSRNTRGFSGMKPNGILMALHDNPQGRKKKKKDTRWYARTVYGSLNRLTGILLHEYGTNEMHRIKAILDQRNNTKS